MELIFDFFVKPLSYVFMQKALLSSLLVSLVCALLGTFVVVRSMAYLGDALAHAILPGVALAYLFDGNLLFGALAAALAASFGIGFLSRKGGVKEDTAIGIVLSSALALGVALISSIKTYAVDLTHILFGNVLGVRDDELIFMALVTLFIVLAVLFFYKPFVLISFDPTFAKTLKMPLEFYRYLLLALLSLTIVVSMRTVGVGLVSAMLISPAASALLLVKRFPTMIVLSMVLATLSSIGGVYLSYYADIASGAAIVLCASFIFLVVFLFSRRKNVLKA